MKKPSYLAVNPAGLPTELIPLRQWVAWKAKLDPTETRWTKILINPHTGRHAKTNGRASWGTLDEALGRMTRDDLDGIGFVVTRDDPFVGIDLDAAVEGEIVSQVAQDMLDRFATYVEFSASGTGLHLLLQSTPLPAASRRRQGIEVYSQGQFLTMTGRPLADQTGINDCSDRFLPWHAECFAPPSRSSVPSTYVDAACPSTPLTEDDRKIVMSCITKWSDFARLFHDGDLTAYDNDDSRADLALLNYFVKAGVTEADLPPLFGPSIMRVRPLRAA